MYVVTGADEIGLRLRAGRERRFWRAVHLIEGEHALGAAAAWSIVFKLRDIISSAALQRVCSMPGGLSQCTDCTSAGGGLQKSRYGRLSWNL